MIGPSIASPAAAVLCRRGIPFIAQVPPIGHVNPNRPIFIEEPLPNGNTVKRVVRAKKAGGGVGVPQNYELTPGNGKVIHAWDAVDGAEGYVIYDADKQPPVGPNESESSTIEEATPSDSIVTTDYSTPGKILIIATIPENVIDAGYYGGAIVIAELV